MSRLVHCLLWLGGLVVAMVMGYTVALEVGLGGGGDRAGDPDALDVAVMYPDAGLWDDFRRGVDLCARRGIVRSAEDHGDALVVRTPVHGRSIRFRHHEARGLRETREQVARLLARRPPPIAVVGSSNTVLTVAIAEALAALSGEAEGPGPVLLIPWASALLAPAREPGEAPTPLLRIAPEGTFRFCLNNQSQADLLVGHGLHESGGRPPRRALIVEDRDDPYSVDLAGSFHRAIEAVAPGAEIVLRSLSPSLSGPRLVPGLPGPEDDLLADSICGEAEALPEGESTWVVLPLQDEPTRRLLQALRRRARPGSPIRVICGDAIGEEDLAVLSGRASFPVSAFSSTGAAGLGPEAAADALIPAEIVAALAKALDLPAGARADARALRDALARLDLSADDPGALGRSLTFRRSGEREGADLGRVLMAAPGRPGVLAASRGPGGGWEAPRPLADAPRTPPP